VPRFNRMTAVAFTDILGFGLGFGSCGLGLEGHGLGIGLGSHGLGLGGCGLVNIADSLAVLAPISTN